MASGKDVNKYDNVRRTAKDQLFVFIFGKEENRKWTLQLYNAVNNSDYKDPSEIEINTIDDYLFMGIKNDVSFILDSIMNVYEHQGSFNPNMPVRELEYVGKLYGKYIAEHDMNIYGSRQLKLPIPKLLVFYNGTDRETEDERYLYLSDSFAGGHEGIEPDISVRVRMLNINKGHNRELLEACKPLNEYSWFIDRVRKNKKHYEKGETAVSKAIDEMPDDYEIKPYLVKHRAEVCEMHSWEIYNEEEVKKLFYKDGYEDGQEEGYREAEKRYTEILADKDTEIANKDAEIARLKEKLKQK